MPDYAIYGIHFYGTALYGLPPRFEFSLDYFEAIPQQYDRIKVEWGHPSGAWDTMRLVRGNYGFPVDQIDGRLLLEVANPQILADVAATTNLGLSGLDAIDGVTPIAGTRVLATAQTTGSQNGLYVAASGAWARAADWDTDAEILTDALIGVEGGTANAGVWRFTTPEPHTVGTTVLTFVKTALLIDPGSYEDVMVSPLRFHYYTIFLRQTASGNWLRGGNALCLLPKNYEYTERLYELLPGVFRDDDIYISTFTGQGMIQSYMSVVGYRLDILRSELDSLLWTATPERMSLGLLQYLAAQLGFPYEAELGGTLTRRQLLNAVYIYKMKGTRLGIEAAAKVLSGWTPTATTESENMLGIDQATFEGTTLTGWYDATDPINSTRARSTAQFAEGVASMAVTKSAGTGAMSARTANGQTPGSLAVQPATMFPVHPNRQYTARASFRAATTARTMSVSIYWHTATGAYISGSPGASVTDTTTGQTVNSVTATAPATAYGASIVVAWDAVPAAEVHYVDAVRFGPGASSAWIAPSGIINILVSLAAERRNRVTNPSAETNTTGWTQGANTTVTRVTTQKLFGAAAFQLAATAGGDVSMMTATGTGGMAVTAGKTYIASMYGYKPSGTVRQLRTDIYWYDAAGAQIGSPVLGVEIPLVIGAWTARPSVAATAPTGATTAAMKVTAIAAGAGENNFFDGAMFEESGMGPYFDGSTPMAGTSISDYLWEGTPHLSRSHYYHRRAVVNSRLVTRMPDFIPAGTTVSFLYAQPQ
jgi:phage tail-like protein